MPFSELKRRGQKAIDKILLTTSGGPFRGWTRSSRLAVRPEDALSIRTGPWDGKITIDSSTMVNKGSGGSWKLAGSLAWRWTRCRWWCSRRCYSFHGAVCGRRGYCTAGYPGYEAANQYALYYPERRFLPGERLNFAKLGSITFENPDMEVFRGLKLAYKAGKRGGSLPTVYNAVMSTQ